MEIVLLPPDLGEMDVFVGICRVRWVGQNHLTAEACLEFPDNSILQEEFNAFLERNGTVMHFGNLGERDYSIADRRTSLQLVDLCVVIERPPMNLEDVRAFR